MATRLTVEALHALFLEADRRYEQRFAAQEQAVAAALASQEKAVAKAEAASERRFEGVNEFRGALTDQANRMATRVEVDRLDEVVQGLQRAKANQDGRMVVVTAAISIGISLLMSLGLWALTRMLGK